MTRDDVTLLMQPGEGMTLLAALARRPRWMSKALCRTESADFFPERGRDTRPAKAVCQECVVRIDCLDHALTTGEHFGIWGGTSERERKNLRRRAA